MNVGWKRIDSLLLVVIASGLFLYGCSENNPATSTSGVQQLSPQTETLLVTSPARFSEYDSSTLIVCDYNSATLVLIDKTSLESVGGFKLKGKPLGAVFASGRFFVANRTAQSVDVYNADGVFQYSFGSGAGLFQKVNDLAHDPSLSLIYVLDAGAAVVRVFDYEGQEASYSIGNGLLLHPTALTVDTYTGELLVSDFGNHDDISPQVFIFDSNGTQVNPMVASAPVVSPMMSLTPPTAPATGFSGNFSSPQGLIIDYPQGGSGERLLFLVDSRAGDVHGYQLSDGTQVVSLGTLGTEVGELFYPLDVHVDPSSRDVFVADHRNGRVTVYREGGVLP